MCCRVNRCCFCFDHILGVKVLACLLIIAEVVNIVLGTLFLPKFLFAIAPTASIGIFCDILLLVAVFKSSRWFVLPWLIYVMIIIVGLGLIAVLRVVIPLGSLQEQNWLIVALSSVGCLAVAGLLLYFWIVVLELFIRLGQTFEGMVYGPGVAMGGPYVGIPIQQYPQQYPYPGVVYQQGYGPPPPPQPPPHMMART